MSKLSPKAMCDGLEIVKSPGPEVNNSMWTSCFLYHCGYKQCEKNDVMRRVFLIHAYCAVITTNKGNLGPPHSVQRAEQLIRMLEYNFPARAHGPGCIIQRNLDIEFIKENWLS